MTALLRADDLAPLAPGRLLSYRQQRYQGDAMSIPLDAFDGASQAVLQQLYALLQELRQRLDPAAAEPASLPALREVLSARRWNALVSQLRQLTVLPGAPVDPLRAAQVLHDLRGGALQALVLQFQFAERCLEFSALDRVLYNLVNNAVRHAVDGEVALALLPVPADEPTELRIGVANRVTSDQRARLHRLVDGDVGRLFGGGLTIGGSGHGLRICADFVQRAYGVESLDAALAGGYFGIAEPDERFIVWVHWPIAGE